MNTMKQARSQYRKTFSHVVETVDKEGNVKSRSRRWDDDAPGLRAFVRENRSLWPAPSGKLAEVLA